MNDELSVILDVFLSEDERLKKRSIISSKTLSEALRSPPTGGAQEGEAEGLNKRNPAGTAGENTSAHINNPELR